MMKPLSIREIQHQLRQGELTVVELAKTYLNQVKACQDYHAVIQVNEHLLEEAKALDTKIKTGQVGSLFGVIILLKDNIGTIDMPVTAGAKVMKATQATRDAFVVDLLKHEDALIIGKANLSEWANYMTNPSSNGFSAVGGQTKNAYGDFDSGGSSSGSAVGVALNLATVAVGSETCGSLVNPSSMNGITTIKPTLGLISRDLVVPITAAQDTLGPMGREIMDTAILFKAMVGYDSEDMVTEIAKKDIFSDYLDQKGEISFNPEAIKGKRFGIVKKDEARYYTLIKELKKLDVELIELNIEQGDVGIDMMPVLDYGIIHDLEAFLNHKDIQSSVSTLEEIIAFNKENPEVNMPYGQSLFEGAIERNLSQVGYEAIRVKNSEIGSSIIDQAIQEHQLEGLISLGTDLAVIYSACGYPAAHVPAGYDEDGCPYGITFVGKPLEDMKLLEFAYSYEQLTRHRKHPFEQ